MTPLRLVLAGAAGSAATDFGDQDPRGADPYGHRQPGCTREQARPLEQFVTVGLRTARLFPSSPVTRRRFWGSGRSRSRVSAERGRRPGRFRRRSPPPCFSRSGGRGRGTGGRARAPCGGNCSPAIRAKIRPEPVREPLSPPGGLSRRENADCASRTRWWREPDSNPQSLSFPIPPDRPNRSFGDFERSRATHPLLVIRDTPDPANA
jgi:hypothetical protein